MTDFPFGVDYYPEHWPEERWPEDVRLMAAAGFNTVRMAEFAWSRLEPHEGVFDFTWLDHVIELLAENGIRTVLGTPTASPPPWVMETDPTQYRVLPDGKPLYFGNRREYCPNHPIYWQHTRRTWYFRHAGGSSIGIDTSTHDAGVPNPRRRGFEDQAAEYRYDI